LNDLFFEREETSMQNILIIFFKWISNN